MIKDLHFASSLLYENMWKVVYEGTEVARVWEHPGDEYKIEFIYESVPPEPAITVTGRDAVVDYLRKFYPP